MDCIEKFPIRFESEDASDARLCEGPSVSPHQQCAAQGHQARRILSSLETIIDLNGNLTEFGSSRKVNSLMMSVMFTIHVLCAMLVVREVLNIDCHKKQAHTSTFTLKMDKCFFRALPSKEAVQEHLGIQPL